MSVLQLDELKNRKRVLRRLGFVNEADVVQLKARVACEISTGDELVISELLFNRFFNEMTPEQCAAVLSCFIFEEKSNESPALKEELAKPFRDIQSQARIVAKVAQECKLPVNEDDYLDTFKPQLMEVVYRWCNGGTFAEIWYVQALLSLVMVANVMQQNDRCLRRKLDPIVQAVGRAPPPGRTGRKGHGERRTGTEV